MTRREWLASLKAGDKVVVKTENRGPDWITRVEARVDRATTTFVFVDVAPFKFRRATGARSPLDRGYGARSSIWPPGEA